MKNRVLTILLVLSLLLSGSGMVAFAAEPSAVATIDGTSYSSLQAAVDAVVSGTQDGTIVLEKSTTEDVRVNGEVYVDLNGKDIQSVTVESGVFYAIDSATNDLVSESADDYGTIGTFTGDVQAAFSPEEDGYGYVMISAENANASFHYVELRITDMVLRPKNETEEAYNPSLYYKCAFTGDEVVAANVELFGVALSLMGQPSEIELDQCGYTKFTDFTPGAQGNTQHSTLLRNVMKETNDYLVNKRNAGLKVYGQAYLKLQDGSYVFGNPQNRTLQEQTELANLLWTRLNSENKAGIREMYNRYTRIMQPWNLTGVTEPLADVMEDVVTWYEEFMNIPIAKENMKEDQLRQLAVDYFRQHLTFRWTPNKEFQYLDFEDQWTTLAVGEGYEGMPYCMDHAHYDTDGDGQFDKDADGNDLEYSVGAGNVYKVMNYYDPATGVVDVASMGAPENVLNILTSNCSSGLGWAWERVSNAVKPYTTQHYVPANGMLPVGYAWNEHDFSRVETTYKEDGTIDRQEIVIEENAFAKIIADNGEEQIYKAYAITQPGDGLISDGHVMMCTGVEVVYKADGTIDIDNSYMWYIDQNAYGSTDEWVTPGGVCREDYTYVNNNGTLVRKMGGLVDDQVKGNKKSFYGMLQKGYVPVTVPEFCTREELVEYKETAASYFVGTDREEEWNTVYAPAYDDLIAKRAVETGSTTSSNELERMTSVSLSKLFTTYGGAIYANYIISNVRVALEDSEGNVIMEEKPYISTNDRSKTVKADTVTGALKTMTQDVLAPYAGKNNTIRIQFQLSNGQWVDVLNAKLRT